MNSPAVNTIVAWLDENNIKSYRVDSHHLEQAASNPLMMLHRAFLPPSHFVNEGRSSVYLTLSDGTELSIQTHPGVTGGSFAETYVTSKGTSTVPDYDYSDAPRWSDMEELGEHINFMIKAIADPLNKMEITNNDSKQEEVQPSSDTTPMFNSQHIEEHSKTLSEMGPFKTETTTPSIINQDFNQMETKKMITLLESVKADKEIMEIARNWNTITPAKLGMLLFELHCTLEQHRKFGTIVKEMISKELEKRGSK